MYAKIIDGLSIARQKLDLISSQIRSLHASNGIKPKLSVILVGDNPASISYIKRKVQFAQIADIEVEVINHDNAISQTALLEEIDKLNQDKSVHGIIIQLPLPKHIDEFIVGNAVDINKDVDGFHASNVGMTFLNHNRYYHKSCVAMSCISLIKSVKQDLSGMRAVVVGSSNTVGKPIMMSLLNEGCSIVNLHSKTLDLKADTLGADILVCAVGKNNLITADMIKKDSIIIDVGINRIHDGENYHIVGDVDFAECSEVASRITPVPGGVGPMTVYHLMENVFHAYRFALGVA